MDYSKILGWSRKYKNEIGSFYQYAFLALFVLVMILGLNAAARPEATESPVLITVPQKQSLSTHAQKVAVRPKSGQPDNPTGPVETRIREIADEIGLKQVDRAIRIAKCESGLRTGAVGDGGKSYGVWQIHLPAHPDITKSQACDLEWSTHWALNRMKQGAWSLWTCDRLT